MSLLLHSDNELVLPARKCKGRRPVGSPDISAEAAAPRIPSRKRGEVELDEDPFPRKDAESERRQIVRAPFDDRLDHLVKTARQPPSISVKIKGARVLREKLGARMLDAMLQTVETRIRSCIGEDHTLVRIGECDFVVLVSTGDAQSARALTDVLELSFESPIHLDGHPSPMAVAVRLTLPSGDRSVSGGQRGDQPEIDRHGVSLSPGREPRLPHARSALTEELLRAASEAEWALYYQPQVSLTDGTLIGFEALLRWRHPQRGILAPSAFLAELETLPEAYGVGRWVLSNACRQLVAWRKDGRSVPRVSVNLFAAQYHSQSLAEDIRTSLHDNGLAPSDLELELTETIALSSEARTGNSLSRLRRDGVGIALDDFGTGFASLHTLKEFPVTRLKIDKSFVEDLCGNPTSSAIVGAVSALGRDLSIDVIAEGVETRAQCEKLVRLGCVSGQGYLFSKPLPARETLFDFASAID